MDEQAGPSRSRHTQPAPNEPVDGGDDHSAMNTTSTHIDNAATNNTPPSSSTSRNVSPVNPVTINEETNRKLRFRWKDEVNEFIYRSYLEITEMETNNIQYSKELYKRVTDKFPELRIKSVQNVLDQRRQLFTKQRIDRNIIDRIRNEVAIELGHIEDAPTPEQDQPDPEQTPERSEDVTLKTFKENFILYHEMDPTKRPTIPKLKHTWQTNKILSKVNEIIQQEVTHITVFTEIHDLIYVGAVTVIKLHQQKMENSSDITKGKKQKPPWQRRIESQIDDLRANIARLTQCISGDPSRKLSKLVSIIMRKHQDNQNSTLHEVLDLLKQKLAVKANRYRRFKESKARRDDNYLFKANQKQFYRNLNVSTQELPVNDDNLPSEENIQSFWHELWSEETLHRQNTKWAREEKQKMEKTQSMISHKITKEDVEKAINRTINWKSPGCDKIHNFWIKKFRATHTHLAEMFNRFMTHPETTPKFLTQGETHLIPKTLNPNGDPSKFRPITCLPTTYKLLTSIITEKIYEHLDKNHILSEEQKGCKKGSQGCKDPVNT